MELPTVEYFCNQPKTEEGRILFDCWKDDEMVADEAMIPEINGAARFNLEAFSDSSWADCKSTRKSTSSGCIFLNGALVMSVCRTQASIALSSCEAELYAANGLMVECIYLFRLCKFLCGDESEVNNDLVQQRLFIDSASALALVRRTGTGRLKHIQINEFFPSTFAQKRCIHDPQDQHQTEPRRHEHKTSRWRTTQVLVKADGFVCRK